MTGSTRGDVVTRSYYLAIEPPNDVLARLSRLMRQLGDPSPVPHVTVVAPPHLSSDLSWWAVLHAVVNTMPTLSVTVAEPRTFDDRVLYLSVDAPMLESVHRNLMLAVSESEPGTGGRATRHYVPHITLAVARRGRHLPRLEEVRPLLFEISPFTATELTLFRRDSATEPYRRWRRIALEGTT